MKRLSSIALKLLLIVLIEMMISREALGYSSYAKQLIKEGDKESLKQEGDYFFSVGSFSYNHNPTKTKQPASSLPTTLVEPTPSPTLSATSQLTVKETTTIEKSCELKCEDYISNHCFQLDSPSYVPCKLN